MRISKNDAIKIYEALGFKNTATWDDAKWAKKLKEIDVDIESSDEFADKVLADLGASIIAAVKKGETIAFSDAKAPAAPVAAKPATTPAKPVAPATKATAPVITPKPGTPAPVKPAPKTPATAPVKAPVVKPATLVTSKVPAAPVKATAPAAKAPVVAPKDAVKAQVQATIDKAKKGAAKADVKVELKKPIAAPAKAKQTETPVVVKAAAKANAVKEKSKPVAPAKKPAVAKKAGKPLPVEFYERTVSKETDKFGYRKDTIAARVNATLSKSWKLTDDIVEEINKGVKPADKVRRIIITDQLLRMKKRGLIEKSEDRRSFRIAKAK